MFSVGDAIQYLLAFRQDDPNYSCCDWRWVANQVFGSLDFGTSFMNYGLFGMIATLGFDTYAPVLDIPSTPSRGTPVADDSSVYFTTPAHELVCISTVAFAGYTTFTAPNSGGVVAVEVSSGKELWRRPFPPPETAVVKSTGSAGGPVVVDGLVVAADGEGTIFGFDAVTGAIRWSIPWVPIVTPGPQTTGRLNIEH